MKTGTKISAISIAILLILLLTSCATTRQAQVDTARRGYMLQDKSEYSRNKGKYKGGASYDKYRKKNQRHMKKQRRK